MLSRLRHSSQSLTCSLSKNNFSTTLANARQFKDIVAANGRAFIVFDQNSQSFQVSTPELQDVVDAFNTSDHALGRDFDSHEGLFVQLGEETNAILGAFVHKTKRGPGAGGVRYWTYNNVTEYLCDGLRLSRGMGKKNALAGLWWGGGKGVIWREDDHPFTDRQFRDTLFQEYGRLMTSLQGCYVTAEDLGVTTEDMRQVFATTRFTTCIPEDVGGSGNPSVRTGEGIVCAMEGALACDNDTLENKIISVQGFGNVSQHMIRYIFSQGIPVKKIIATDVSEAALEQAEQIRKDYPNSKTELEVRLVPYGDNSALFEEDADIVSPCAVGGTLNPETIPNIRAKYIVGAANNQLLNDERDDALISSFGKIYVPDFLANRMGIVNCSNEQYGYVNDDPAILRHLDQEWENSIFVKTKQVIEMARSENISTGRAADRIADELMRMEHPINGHRPWKVIETLMANEWHRTPRPLAYE